MNFVAYVPTVNSLVLLAQQKVPEWQVTVLRASLWVSISRPVSPDLRWGPASQGLPPVKSALSVWTLAYTQ